ncbi:class I SAM-dependent methyltransferase [Variovorax robiniae]|uniref:Class I SAM-dependent methyltransferase n=1 Tax=Variovorax robiniae TaxID=1836199 RepID=A0ABU8XA61_9BURK
MQFVSAALAEPRHLFLPTSWAGHIPFALWLMPVLKPANLVEIGTTEGNSYLGFCQAIQQHNLRSRAFAIGDWAGENASSDSIQFKSLKQAHDPAYGGFSELLRVNQEGALQRFADGSIDLLHIAGRRSDDAAREIFRKWLPKLSPRAIVLFHHTEGDSGLRQLWGEMSAKYPSFHFNHGCGLGVLLTGSEPAPELMQLSTGASHNDRWVLARQFFQTVGHRWEARAEVDELRGQLQGLESSTAEAIAQRDDLIIQLKNSAAVLQKNVLKADAVAREMRQLLVQAVDRSKKIEELLPSVSLDARVEELEQERADLLGTIAEIKSSRSWRITSGYRMTGTAAKRGGNLLKLVLAGRWDLIRQRFATLIGAEGPEDGQVGADATLLTAEGRQQIVASGKLLSTRVVEIVTPPHTLFVAESVRRALARVNIQAEISSEMPGNFDKDLYVVFCPQVFDRLPPGDKRICFQMEQSVSSRWFTPAYLDALKNSLGVFDYSIDNLSFLQKNEISYPCMFLMPIGGIPGYAPASPEAHGQGENTEDVDVLFYGDIHNERRKRMLDKIGKKFSVRIISNLFGEALEKEIRRARVVVNLHYYENALLETTRIYECLSLGARVVSEVGSDQREHDLLSAAVSFVPVGDVDAVLEAIGRELRDDGACRQRAMDRAVQESAARFDFMLFRALRALQVINGKTFDRVARPPAQLGSKIALSLPETPERRAAFQKIRPSGFSIFDGIRATPGWVGCALSYQYLARNALQNDVNNLVICEDDVEFPPLFDQKMSRVLKFLDSREGQWDIFAGLIADLHNDVKILDLVEEDGLTIVVIDKMTSGVYNIYSRHALELLSNWRVENNDVVTNTIDRYLERTASLRVVTTLPFAAGHRVDADSSLWGISNQQYVDMISRSERRLEGKVWEFKARRALARDLSNAEPDAALLA